MQNYGSGFIAVINYSSTQSDIPQPAPQVIFTEDFNPILTESFEELTTE